MSKITDFFTQAKSSKNQSDNQRNSSIVEATAAQQFYEHCLTIQDELCDKIECINTKATLKLELKSMQEKCLNIKEAVDICAEIIAAKDIEINNLIQQLEIAVVPALDTPANTCVADKPDPVAVESIDAVKSTTLFNEFQDEFSADVLSSLRSIEKDSNFINLAMKSLYAGKLDSLKNKSVTGRGRGGRAKEPVTPEKHSVLKAIYTERIYDATQNCAERVSRQKMLNKYIKDAIHNITRTNATQELEKETCQRLQNDTN